MNHFLADDYLMERHFGEVDFNQLNSDAMSAILVEIDELHGDMQDAISGKDMDKVRAISNKIEKMAVEYEELERLG